MDGWRVDKKEDESPKNDPPSTLSKTIEEVCPNMTAISDALFEEEKYSKIYCLERFRSTMKILLINTSLHSGTNNLCVKREKRN